MIRSRLDLIAVLEVVQNRGNDAYIFKNKRCLHVCMNEQQLSIWEIIKVNILPYSDWSPYIIMTIKNYSENMQIASSLPEANVLIA